MIKQDYYATNKQGNCVNYGFKCFSCSHWYGYFNNGSCDMFKTTFTTSSSMIKEDLGEVTANGLRVMEEMGIKITPKKRFNIVKSKLVKNAHVIEDGKKQFTFPTLIGDERGLIAYKKALNKLSEENYKLKCKVNGLESELIIWKEDVNEQIKEINKLFEENKKLKKELFESKKDYITETYSNNPVRRNKKLQILKEEFKKRFSDLNYITSNELLFDIINEAIEKSDEK